MPPMLVSMVPATKPRVPEPMNSHHQTMPTRETRTVFHSTALPPERWAMAMRSVSSMTSFGSTMLANGMNHAPMVQPAPHRRGPGLSPAAALWLRQHHTTSTTNRATRTTRLKKATTLTRWSASNQCWYSA
jgi:hypothetical protein